MCLHSLFFLKPSFFLKTRFLTYPKRSLYARCIVGCAPRTSLLPDATCRVLTHFLSIQPADMQVDFIARLNLAHPSIDHMKDSLRAS